MTTVIKSYKTESPGAVRIYRKFLLSTLTLVRLALYELVDFGTITIEVWRVLWGCLVRKIRAWLLSLYSVQQPDDQNYHYQWYLIHFLWKEEG